MSRASRRGVEEQLSAIGRAPVPGPDPAFVDRLAARLGSIPIAYELDEAPAPRLAGRALTPARAATVMAAIAASVIVVLSLLTRPQGVTSIGPADAPSTTLAPTTTTTSFTIPPDPWAVPTTSTPAPGVFGMPTTTSTTQEPSVAPGTTAPPREKPPAPTTTTVPPRPSTTSTTRPPPERLGFSCRPIVLQGRSGIACEWSQSSRPTFASYQLHKATGGNPPRVVFTTRDRSVTRFFDGDVAPGGTYSYGVRALDANGRVIGEGPKVTTTCC
ncbi:MAG TPA: hypothetical protein VM030_07500 [Acidimicrobiales bacterium]|nr:hypothetical protein [Acidimicrobiales bacterium]